MRGTAGEDPPGTAWLREPLSQAETTYCATCLSVAEMRSATSRPPRLVAGGACACRPLPDHEPGLGLALDTTQQHGQGHRVASCSPDALPHQLWYLRPSGAKGETTIISAASDLALDSTPETFGDIHPVMWEPNGTPWQRWQLKPTLDKDCYLIKSLHNGNFLTLTEEARWHLDDAWAPWFASQMENPTQQGDFSLVHG